VLQYDLRLPNVAITEAKTRVVRELPSDAHPVAFVVKSSCAFELLRSTKLGRALAPIGDRSGAVLVEFGSGAGGNQYDPSTVNDALFSLGATSPSNVPAC
jgi:hypothetical protein